MEKIKENVKEILDQSIKNYLLNNPELDKYRLNKITDIWNDSEIKIIKNNEIWNWFNNEPRVWFKFKVYKLSQEVWSMTICYNIKTDRFNISHRLISKESPIRWKELFAIIEYFIKWISVTFPNLVWREMYSRQKQVINRAIDKLWFEIDYIHSNDLWKIRINNQNDERLETIDWYLLDDKNPIKWIIISKNMYSKDSIIKNLDWVVDIVLTKKL